MITTTYETNRQPSENWGDEWRSSRNTTKASIQFESRTKVMEWPKRRERSKKNHNQVDDYAKYQRRQENEKFQKIIIFFHFHTWEAEYMRFITLNNRTNHIDIRSSISSTLILIIWSILFIFNWTCVIVNARKFNK